MPLDVIAQLNDAKGNVNPENEMLLNNLDRIQEKALSSSESMNALRSIVAGLTEGGNNLSNSLEKVVFYFDKFEEKTSSLKKSAFGITSVYNELGNIAPNQLKKIEQSLEQVYEMQEQLGRGVRFSALDNVQILTKEVSKLRNVLKNMPKIPSGGSPVGKFALGGEIPGNSTSGDRVPILANSGEYILNKFQMNKLGRALGGKSPQQVFQYASGRKNIKGSYKQGRQAFASGGLITNDSSNAGKTTISSVIASLSNSGNKNDQQVLKYLKSLQGLLTKNLVTNQEAESIFSAYFKRNTKGQLVNSKGKFISQGDAVNLIRQNVESNSKSWEDTLSKLIEKKIRSSAKTSGRHAGKFGGVLNSAESALETEKNVFKNTTGETRENAKNKMTSIRDFMAMNKAVNKSNDRNVQGKFQSAMKSRGITNTKQLDDFLKNASPEKIEELNEELRESLDLLGDMEKEVSDLSGVHKTLGDEADSLIKKYSSWLGGTPVGLAAVAAGVALIVGQVVKLSKEMTAGIVHFAKLSRDVSLLQNQLTAFGSGVYLEGLRNELTLTREQALLVGESLKQASLVSAGNVERVSQVARNLKQYLGEVDVTSLREATQLINSLPNKQIDVMLKGTGDLDDEANLIANLIEKGQLDTSINLLAKGAFGKQNGLEALPEKDKAMIEAQNATNKTLEDIKMGLYKWMPGWLEKFAIYTDGFTRFASQVVAPIAQLIITAVAMRKLIGAMGMGYVRTKDIAGGMNNGAGGMSPLDFIGFGGKGKGGKWSRYARRYGKRNAALKMGQRGLRNAGRWAKSPKGMATLAFAAEVGYGFWDSHRQQKAVEKEQEAEAWQNEQDNKNLSRYGTTKIETVNTKRVEAEAQKAEASARSLVSTIGFITTGLASLGASIFATPAAGAAVAAGGTAATIAASETAAWAAYYKKYKEEMVKETGGDNSFMMKDNEKKGSNWNPVNWFRSSRVEDEVMSKYVEEHLKLEKEAEKLQEQLKKDQEKQLKSQTAIKQHLEEIKKITSGAYTAINRALIGAYKTNNASIKMLGGSNADFAYNNNQIYNQSSNAWELEMNMLKKQKNAVMNNKDMTEPGRLAAMAEIQKQELAIHQRLVENLESVVGKFSEMPSVMVATFKNALASNFSKFMSDNMMGSGNEFEQTSTIELAKQLPTILQQAQNDLAKVEDARRKIEGTLKTSKDGRDAALREGGFGSMGEADAYVHSMNQRKVEGYSAELPGLIEKMKQQQEANYDLNHAVRDKKEVKAEDVEQNRKNTLELFQQMKKHYEAAGDTQQAELIQKAIDKLNSVEKGTIAQKTEAMSGIGSIEYKALINHFQKKQMGNMSDEEKKKYESALKAQTHQLTLTGASNAETLQAKQRKQIYDNYIKQVTDIQNAFIGSLDRTFNDGAMKFQNALERYFAANEKYNLSRNGGAYTVNKDINLARDTYEVAKKNLANMESHLDEVFSSNMAEWQKAADSDKTATGETLSADAVKLKQLTLEEAKARAAVLKNPEDAAAQARLNQIMSQIESLKSSSDDAKKYSKSDDFRLFQANIGGLVKAAENFNQANTEVHKRYIEILEKYVNSVDKLLQGTDISQHRSRVKEGEARSSLLETRGDYQGAHKAGLESVDAAVDAANAEITAIAQNLQEQIAAIEASDYTDAEKTKAIAELKANSYKKGEEAIKRITQAIKNSFKPLFEELERRQESVNIELDLAQSIGAPFEYIVELEKKTVSMAREKAELARQEYEKMKSSGKDAVETEKAKMRWQKAQADVIKASLGAQRDSIDKMMSKLLGGFQEVGGIFGPDSARMNAYKYGQGYSVNANGTMSGHNMGGYNDRMAYINSGNPNTMGSPQNHHDPFKGMRFAVGGEIPGNSINGDKVPILANSGEWILNKSQMKKLGEYFGTQNEEDVFDIANGVQKFAKGGKVKRIRQLGYDVVPYGRGRRQDAGFNRRHGYATQVSTRDAMNFKRGKNQHFVTDFIDEQEQLEKQREYAAKIQEIAKSIVGNKEDKENFFLNSGLTKNGTVPGDEQSSGGDTFAQSLQKSGTGTSVSSTTQQKGENALRGRSSGLTNTSSLNSSVKKETTSSGNDESNEYLNKIQQDVKAIREKFVGNLEYTARQKKTSGTSKFEKAKDAELEYDTEHRRSFREGFGLKIKGSTEGDISELGGLRKKGTLSKKEEDRAYALEQGIAYDKLMKKGGVGTGIAKPKTVVEETKNVLVQILDYVKKIYKQLVNCCHAKGSGEKPPQPKQFVAPPKQSTKPIVKPTTFTPAQLAGIQKIYGDKARPGKLSKKLKRLGKKALIKGKRLLKKIKNSRLVQGGINLAKRAWGGIKKGGLWAWDKGKQFGNWSVKKFKQGKDWVKGTRLYKGTVRKIDQLKTWGKQKIQQGRELAAKGRDWAINKYQQGKAKFNEKVFGKVSEQRLREIQKQEYARTGKRPSLKSIKQSLADKSIVGRFKRGYNEGLKGHKPTGRDFVSRTARTLGKGKHLLDVGSKKVTDTYYRGRRRVIDFAKKSKNWAVEKYQQSKVLAGKGVDWIKGTRAYKWGQQKIQQGRELWKKGKAWGAEKYQQGKVKLKRLERRIITSPIGRKTISLARNLKNFGIGTVKFARNFRTNLSNMKTGFQLGYQGGTANAADSKLDRFAIGMGNRARNITNNFKAGYNGSPEAKGFAARVGRNTRRVVDFGVRTRNNFMSGYNKSSNSKGFVAGVGRNTRRVVDFGVRTRNNFKAGYNKSPNARGFAARTGRMTRWGVDKGISAKNNFMAGYNKSPNAKGFFAGAGWATGATVRFTKAVGSKINLGTTGFRLGLRGGKVNGADTRFERFSINAGRRTRYAGAQLRRNFKPNMLSAGMGFSGVTNMVMGADAYRSAGKRVETAQNDLDNARNQLAQIPDTPENAEYRAALTQHIGNLENNLQVQTELANSDKRNAVGQIGQGVGLTTFGFAGAMKNPKMASRTAKAGMFVSVASSLPGLFSRRAVEDPNNPGRMKTVWDGHAASYSMENLAQLSVMGTPLGRWGANTFTRGPGLPTKGLGWSMAAQAAGGLGEWAADKYMGNDSRFLGMDKTRTKAAASLLGNAGGLYGDIALTMSTGGLNKIVEGGFDVGRKLFTAEGQRRAANVGGTLETFDTITKLAGTQTLFNLVGSGATLLTGNQKYRDYFDIGGAINEIDMANEYGKAVNEQRGANLTGSRKKRYDELAARQARLTKESTSFGRQVFGGRSDEEIDREYGQIDREMMALVNADNKERREKALAQGRGNATKAIGRVDKTLAEFGSLKDILNEELKKNDTLSVKHSAPAEEKRKKAEEDRKKTEDALRAKREELAALEDTPENKEKREALSKDIRTLEGTLATQVKEEQKLGTQAKSSALVGDLFKQLRNDASGDLKGQLEAITAGEASVKELRTQLEEAAKKEGIGSEAYNKIARALADQEATLSDKKRAIKKGQAKLSGLDKAWGDGQIGGDAMIEIADQQRAAYDEAIAKEEEKLKNFKGTDEEKKQLEANIAALKKKREKYVLTDEQRNLLKGRAADGSLIPVKQAGTEAVPAPGQPQPQPQPQEGTTPQNGQQPKQPTPEELQRKAQEEYFARVKGMQTGDATASAIDAKYSPYAMMQQGMNPNGVSQNAAVNDKTNAPGGAGGVNGTSGDASNQGKATIELLVNVKFDNGMFRNEVVKVISESGVAAKIVNTALNS